MHIVKQLGSTIPIYLENAADFNIVGNPHFGKDSIVVIASISGDTKEIVELVDHVHAMGAKVLGYVEKKIVHLRRLVIMLSQQLEESIIFGIQ